MSCRLIDAYLDQADTQLDPEAARHLQECDRCRRLVEALGRPSAAAKIPAALRARIEQTLLGSLRPVRPLPPARAFIITALAVFASFAVLGIAVMGLSGAHAANRWQLGVVLLILSAGAALLALSLTRQMIPGSSHRIRPVTLVASIAVALLAAIGLLFPWSASRWPLSSGWTCTVAGLGLAVPAAVLLWLLLRRGAVLSPALTGATAGLLAGLPVVVSLQFGCAMLQASHVAVWHAGAALATALGGFLLGYISGRR